MPPALAQERGERSDEAAITRKKRKAATSSAASSSAPPPKRPAYHVLSPEQEAAREAAVRAAGVAVAQGQSQATENARLQTLVETTRQEAEVAKSRLASLEGQLAAQLRETRDTRDSAADRVALLVLEAEREERELQAVVDEYIKLKASMKRIRVVYEARHGRTMRARSTPELYRAAERRREELLSAFPGRPWAKHPDYLRIGTRAA